MATQNAPFSWPTDADGNPKVLITARVQELIPTAKFANVELDLTLTGFDSSFADDGDIEGALEAAYDKADSVLQKKRDPILEELDEGNK